MDSDSLREKCAVRADLKAKSRSRAACQDGPQKGQGEEYLDTLAGDIQWRVNLRARLEICHDECGDAVRRATENGNGALVGPSNSAE